MNDLYLYGFHGLEAFAFILPALPESIYLRLFILVIYFIMHFYGVQKQYAIIKHEFLHDD